MNLQSLVVVALRLMALDFLLRAAIESFYIVLSQTSPMDHGMGALPWLVLAALIASAIVLWFLALPIARLVTRGVPHGLSFGTMALLDCYTIAFMAVGLFYVSKGLPQVLNWTHYLFKLAASTNGTSWKDGVNWYDVTQVFVPFIFGVVLFLKGRGWAMALARREKESESPAAQVGPQDKTGA